jgi:ATP-dependent protease ClpP protease subunit
MVNTYRFRNRLPKAGEGKSPRAQLDATRDANSVVTLWLYDVIDSWGGYWGISADEVRKALDEFPASQVSEIHVHVNSPGGDVFEAAAINNILAAHPAPVKVMVDGLAASAASVVAVRADELVMGVGTELMIHDVWTIVIGSSEDLLSAAAMVDKTSNDLAAQYAAKAGGDTATWRAAMLAETWYTADEAVEAGLADRVGTLSEADQVEAVSEGDDDLAEELLLAASIENLPRARAALAHAARPIREPVATPATAIARAVAREGKTPVEAAEVVDIAAYQAKAEAAAYKARAAAIRK